MATITLHSAVTYHTACRQLCRQHAVFAHIHQLYGPPPQWQRPPGLATLVRIILEQQVSLQAAAAHYQRLLAHVQGQLSPQSLLSLSPGQWRACQVSQPKSRYLQHLAQAVQQGLLTLEQLPHLPDEEVQRQLCQIKGIGPWTANVYLMFALQRADCFAPGDVALLRTLRQLLPGMAKATPQQLLACTLPWQPWRTVAAFYLWWYYLCSRGRTLPF
ncbi:MAG TPA: DNA-3-methyladenine glycosylase 2 family protein [Phnomibacter sp.]|nr:DNA-3-methyladenine glycosylase 2 family protein [Phnomibacter sp.]